MSEKPPTSGKIIDLQAARLNREAARLQQEWAGQSFEFKSEDELTYDQVKTMWQEFLLDSPAVCAVIRNETADGDPFPPLSNDDLLQVLNNVRSCPSVDAQCEFVFAHMKAEKRLIPYLQAFLPND